MKVVWKWIGFVLVAAVVAEAAESRLLTEYTLRRWSVEDGMPEAVVTFVQQQADGYLRCHTPHHCLRFDGVRFVELTGQASPLAPVAITNCVPPETVASEVTATVTDEEGALWVGTLRGLYRWRAGQWSGLTARDGVFPCDVRCVTIDREGNVWVGTSGGLIRLRRKRVTMFRTGLSVGDESITALLAESPANFWVGVAGGGLLYGTPGALRRCDPGLFPKDATVSVLHRGRDGTLWVGTQGDSLWRWRRDGDISRMRKANRGGMSARGISALLEDGRGRLWVGTWEGLMQVDREGLLVPVNETADMVQVLYEDRDEQVWVGYQRVGLLCFRRDGSAQWFGRKDGLPDGSLFSFYQDSTGVLWIGSTSGLLRWQGNSRHLFTTANGLVDNVILQILEDEIGDLWLGTRRGIMRIRRSEFEEVIAGRKMVMAVRHLGLEAGMADEECTGRLGARAARTADGRLWFPTMEGIAMVEPKEVPPQPVAPPVYVEEVWANGRRMARAAENILPPIHLPRGLRAVEFRFTAPVFTAPDRAHFKFQLAGFDSEWSKASAERTARYARLPAGEYQFRVMARDRDSEWSRVSRPVTVVVPPFFWETTWFWLLAGLLGLALAGSLLRGYYRRQVTARLEELERRHAVERERARIARDIHDDVGAGLTEVAILSELAQAESNQPQQLRERLDAIFRRARELTQSLNEIVWAINPANDTLDSFVSYVGEFAQDFLGTAGLACRLKLPSEPPAVAISATVRHHLWLAIKETLHNVVKHAGATEVHLSVTLNGPVLTVTIQDNGRGFEADTVSGVATGRNGLGNLETRLAEIGGRFHQQSRPGEGTRTILSVILPTVKLPTGDLREGDAR